MSSQINNLLTDAIIQNKQRIRNEISSRLKNLTNFNDIPDELIHWSHFIKHNGLPIRNFCIPPGNNIIEIYSIGLSLLNKNIGEIVITFHINFINSALELFNYMIDSFLIGRLQQFNPAYIELVPHLKLEYKTEEIKNIGCPSDIRFCQQINLLDKDTKITRILLNSVNYDKSDYGFCLGCNQTKSLSYYDPCCPFIKYCCYECYDEKKETQQLFVDMVNELLNRNSQIPA